MTKVIGDVELFREFVAEFGVIRTATLLGWAAMWVLTGASTKEEMLRSSLGSPATLYRVLADYRRLRDRLVAKGYVLSEEGTEAEDVAELVRLAAAA